MSWGAWVAGVMLGIGLAMLGTSLILKDAIPKEIVDKCVAVNGDMSANAVRQFCKDKLDAVTRPHKE